MLERLRSANALVLAFAAWSAGLLVLALAGLGGRVGPHPDNPGLAPAVPDVQLSAVAQRLGPVENYAALGDRPLLNPDRRPSAVRVAAETGNADALDDLVLTSVLIAGQTRLALLQHKDGGEARRVRVGDFVPSSPWRLAELEPRRALFDGPTGRRELALRVFDGRGAVQPNLPPPPAAAPAPVAATGTPGPGPGPDGTKGNSPATAMPVPAPAQPAVAPPGQDVAAPTAAEMTQEQQIEAIRRRIEARRAQMRAEAGNPPNPEVE